MSDVWDDIADPLGDRIASDLRDIVRRYETGAERSQQTHLGPSQIGSPCTRCLARAVLGMSITGDFDDPWCRIIGTATHTWLDEAAAWDNLASINEDRPARWHPERRVQPDDELLPSGGKADLYDEKTRTVIDHKVVGDAPLKKYKLNGPGPTYRVQAHTYGLGYAREGIAVEHVAVAFWKRGGRLSDLYVWTEPYDESIALAALDRYRTIRDQALAIGPAILAHLPAHPDCWDCSGKDVSAEELAVISNTTRPDVA